jgi:hypothetical protein
VFADAAVRPEASIAPKKHSLLPLLTVLFLFSYGLMTMLIVEQGTTIESQRGLIREMLQDSVELSAMKGKVIQDKNMSDARRRTRAHVQAPLTQAPSTQAQVPSTHAPSTQIPMSQAPSTQVAPNRSAQNQSGKIQKPRFQAPPRPASDLADERRAVTTI